MVKVAQSKVLFFRRNLFSDRDGSPVLLERDSIEKFMDRRWVFHLEYHVDRV